MQRARQQTLVGADGSGFLVALSLAALALLAMPGCAGLTGARDGAPAAATAQPMLTAEDEALFGANLDAAINAETSPASEALQDYFQGLLDQLANEAGADRQGMNLSVKVLDGPEEVNIFSTPSGSIYVFSGVLLATADEAEVAALLAHELGHVVGRHAIAALTRGFGINMVKSLAVSQSLIARDPNLSAGLLSATFALVTGGAQQRHEAAEEQEADARALRYLDGEGYESGALGSFLGEPRRANDADLSVLHAAHPLSNERLALLPMRKSRKRLKPGPSLVALKSEVAAKKRADSRSAKKNAAKTRPDAPSLDKANARR